jgi:hypothetical protein
MRALTVIGESKPTSHRYWYFVNRPEIGVYWKQGWTFGADALSAATHAIGLIRRDTPAAEHLRPNDVKVTHCTACACIPAEFRTW